MNIELLRKVEQAILQSPEQFDMEDWFSTSEELYRGIPNCGMAACIGGWALTINAGSLSPRKGYQSRNQWTDENWHVGSENNVKSLLDLPNNHLLYLGRWPLVYLDAYRLAMRIQDYKKAAQVAVDRIEFYIATNGTDEPEYRGQENDT